MERRDFIRVIGSGVASLSLIAFLEQCSKSNNAPTVDFTIDLTNSQYSSLNTPGNYIYVTNNTVYVIIASNSTGILAVNSACTHAGCTVQYAYPQNEFICPCHGSIFNSGGGVTQGPAQTALTSYNVTKTGSKVHIFS